MCWLLNCWEEFFRCCLSESNEISFLSSFMHNLHNLESLEQTGCAGPEGTFHGRVAIPSWYRERVYLAGCLLYQN